MPIRRDFWVDLLAYHSQRVKLLHSPNKQCDFDPITTFLLKRGSATILPVISTIVNLSLSTGTFPIHFKQSLVTQLLKKPSHDKNTLINCPSISNLSLFSRITECIVKSHLNEHLSSNSMYNPNQSAYTKHHSTETTFLYRIQNVFIVNQIKPLYYNMLLFTINVRRQIYFTNLYTHVTGTLCFIQSHYRNIMRTGLGWLSLHDDHLVATISHHQVSCFCQFELSVAFDTIDHSILLHCLSSWCGITDTALIWFKTYLSSRSFSVIAFGFTSPYPLSCGVPQGSVLGPIPFKMYTTPLSTLILSQSLNHQLHADNTQLFIFFAPKTFITEVGQLQDTIADISFWMTSNVLSFNTSKTELMLIGLIKEISKHSNPSLSLSSKPL